MRTGLIAPLVAIGLAALGGDLVAAVNRTMGPSHAGLWLRERTK